LHCCPYQVQWLDFGHKALSESFFQWSWASIKGTGNVSSEVSTGVETLIHAAQRTAPTMPSGVIVHMTRCGSTWISNCLKAADNAVVVAEAPVMDQVLSDAFTPTLSNDESTRQKIVVALSTIFSRYETGNPKKVVFKLGIYGLPAMKTIRLLWPELPIVVVIRNPSEVIASNLNQPARWLCSRWFLNRDFDWHSSTSRGFSDEDYCGKVLGTLCEAGAAAIDENTMILDYRNIGRESILKVGVLFGLWSKDVDPERILRPFELDSKDRRGQQTYVSRAEMQSRYAPEAIRAAADKWVMSSYERLLALESGILRDADR
jgi:hypothetical protein